MEEYRLITGPETGLDVFIDVRFLSTEKCDHLVDCLERNIKLVAKDAPGNEFFDDRYLWITSLPETEPKAKWFMQEARMRICEILQRFYEETEPIYSDTIQLVKWWEGIEHTAHADNEHPDGSLHNTPFRDYAAVVYLNDDYEGGEFFIEPLKIMLRPEKGTMVCFRGDMSHMHGVKMVTKGLRYTMPSWYTKDIQHRDPSELTITDPDSLS
ncbi:MAG: 2OG-Fe(II) oxygenase [Alphaproteobacteria bacterium]|nr:2OG-Fe(II) oxygenase [Alphaproteobacteria bacterium]